MKKILCAIMMVYGTVAMAYDPPEILLSATSGSSAFDGANAVKATMDNGYIVVGSTYANDGDVTGFHGGMFDAWVVKYNAAGQIEWEHAMGGSGEDNFYQVRQLPDGNYLLTGYTNSTDGDITSNHGMFDYWVVKLDGDGNTLWEKCYGGSNRDYAIGSDLTPDGGFILIGHALSTDGDVTGNHGWDYWVVKANADGMIEWEKCYGGSDLDYGTCVHPTTDGGYILGGQAYSNDGDITSPYGVQDYWIVKTDNIGNIQWQISLGGSDEEYCNEVIQTSDGGYIINGTTVSSDGLVSDYHGAGDSWVVKLDEFGNYWWSRTLGSSWFDYGNSVVEMPYGYAVLNSAGANDGDVSGNHGGMDVWVVKLNYMGETDWQHCYGGSEWDAAKDGSGIELMPDGGLLIAGQSSSVDGDVIGNNGNYDFWIFRTAREECESVHDFYPPTLTATTALLNWDPVPGGQKYRLLWRKTGETTWQKVTTGGNGLWLLTGLQCNSTYQWKLITGCDAGYISDFSTMQTFTTMECRESDVSTATIHLFPNPATDRLTITGLTQKTLVAIYDMNGRLLQSEINENANAVINISEVPSGMYLVKITSEDTTTTLRLAVEK